jgi:penicillin-binding protein 2
MAVNKTLSGRRFVVGVIFLAIGLIFIVRLFYIQIIETSYKSSADNNVLRYITEYPARGLVYDRTGKLLVFNEATYDLTVIPKQVNPDMDTVALCKLIGMEKEILRKKMIAARNYSSYLPSIVDEKLTPQTYGLLQEKLIAFPGFYVQARTIRNYPQPIAAHILGYIGEVTPELLKKDDYYRPGDYLGISGIEKSYEKELRGRKGIKIIMVDVHGRDKGSYLSGKYDVEASAGLDLYTSLDIDLQTYGEKLMQNKRGSIVAIEPATGEILALISSPTYDPGLLVGRDRAKNYFTLLMDKNLPLFNRALTGKYPPGSTFKPIVGLIAEQEGVLTPDTRYPCYGGFPLGNGKSIGCHIHYSPLDLIGAVEHSCNAYFCKVFKTCIDNKAFHNPREALLAWRKYMFGFALGQKTGVDLPNESSGNIPTPDYYDKVFGKNRWRALSIISIAIGQGEIQLTPLQMANAASIIANRGNFYTPHIVRDIGKKDTPNPRFMSRRTSGINTEYFNSIIEGMFLVVESGTAHNIRMDSIKICGKTGTAQNAGKNNHSIFIAFAPKDNPKIAIAVVVENSGAGATWAAPISSLMIERYLTHKVKRTGMENDIISGKTIN